MLIKNSIGVQSLPAGSNIIGRVGLTSDGYDVAGLTMSYDEAPASRRAISVGSNGYLFNGSSWDRWRNNQEGTLLPFAIRNANVKTAMQTNYNAKGIVLHLHIKSVPTTSETLKVRLFANDVETGAGSFGIIADSTTESSTTIPNGGIYKLFVYPSIVYSSTDDKKIKVNNMVLPRKWSADVVHNGTGSWEYALSYSLIL